MSKKHHSQKASSARAAELLQAEGINVPYVSFEALSLLQNMSGNESGDVGSLLDALSGSMDDELKIAFKRLSKRDLFTREKAVKELLDILKSNQTDYEKIKVAFPNYAVAYPKLVTDSSALIRSTSNQVVGFLISNLKKDASPQLKTVLPLLFFSTCDAHPQVSKSAEDVIATIFPADDKKQKAIQTFGGETMTLCLDMLSRQHSLMSPQKFADNETDQQRQTRLTAQSLNCLDKFSESSPGTIESVAPKFATSSTFSCLMAMDNNVKAASFQLLKKILKNDVSAIIPTRIPSFILQTLDSSDILLCRNAFECFLILAADDRFYETCKIDKAVVPKILSIVRRKNLHWSILESSLLPCIALIHDHLPTEARVKWLQSVLDSFFDGIEQGLPLVSWAKAFAEAFKFSFIKFSLNSSVEFFDFLIQKAYDFVDLVIVFGEKKGCDSVVDLIMWLDGKRVSFPEGKFETYWSNLTIRLLQHIPKGVTVVQNLVEKSGDYYLANELMKKPECSNETFLRCYRSLDEDAIDMSAYGQIIAERFGREHDDTRKKDLLTILWDLVDDGQVDEKFDELVKVDDFSTANAIIEVCDENLFDVVRTSFKNTVAAFVVLGYLNGESVNSERILFWLENGTSSGTALDIIEHACHAEFTRLFSLSQLLMGSVHFKDHRERLFDILIDCYSKLDLHEEDETILLNEILTLSKDLGKYCDAKILSKVIENVKANHYNADSITSVAKFLGHIGVAQKELMQALCDIEELKSLITAIGAKYSLNAISEANYSRILSTTVFDKLIFNFDFNLSTSTHLALFYGNLAYSSRGRVDVSSKSCFAFTSLYLLLVELAYQFEAEQNMFESVELKEYQLLLNILDRVLQEPVFEYQDVMKVPMTSAHIYLILTALNDRLRRLNRRHCRLDPVEPGLMTLQLTLIENCEKIVIQNSLESGKEFLEQFVFEQRQNCEEWLFTVNPEKATENAATCAMLRLCSELIGKVELSDAVRDFFLCGLICAMQTITDSFSTLKGRSDFYSQLAAFYCLKLVTLYDEAVGPKNAGIGLEWMEFYRPAATGYILNWYFSLSPSSCGCFSGLLINAISSAVFSLTSEEILAYSPPDEVMPCPLDLTWNNCSSKLKSLTTFILTNVFSDSPEVVKAAATYILKCCTLDLYKAEQTVVSERPQHEEDETMEQQLKDATNEEQRLPELYSKVLVSDNSNVTIVPKLIIWDSLMSFLGELDVLLRAEYAKSIPVAFSDEMLNVLIALLPPEPEKVLKECHFNEKLSVGGLFSRRFHPTGSTFVHKVCNLFFRTLTTIPSVVRTWFNELPKATLVGVQAYIKKYLSPLIIERELKALGNFVKGRLSVKVMPAVNEIVAAYRFEDTTLSLNITLPADYPLSKALVDQQRAIVNKDLLRRWLLQLVLFLDQQNGLMLEGILQWKRNIDNHLEGIDDCTICMMTVSASNYTLPRISCRQCKKKFHGDCLYKWFDSSNNPTCPLCRSPFYN